MNADELIEQLREGRLDPAALGEHMSAAELARLLAQPGFREQVDALCEVGEIQARLVASRFRAAAATRLMSIATGDEAAPETIRRACVDVLKLGLAQRATTPAQDNPAAALRAVVEDDG